MRRFVHGPGARFGAPPSGGRMDALLRLRRALSAPEYDALRRLVGGMRHLPFGRNADALEHLLLCARDDDMELLIKCERALTPGGPVPGDGEDAASDAEPARHERARLSFRFEADSRELRAFVGSLRRNGFRAVTVGHGIEAVVFVELGGASDLEIVRAMDLVRSVRDIVGWTAAHALRGHRVGR